MERIKKILHTILWLIKGIQVFALVGKSGSGKSFRAQLVAQKHGIELIIDDGLLIKGQKILAGKSAKKEAGMLTAIKTALFNEDEHAEEVKNALRRENFKRILILGTSIAMTKKIAKRLGLPPPSKIIKIEDIATTEEIDTARRIREEEGKHIIPVPAIEVKKNYPHIFFDSVKVLLSHRFRLFSKDKTFEKTVVRPQYSKRGKVAISETALTQMVLHCIDEFNPELKVSKIIIHKNNENYSIEIILTIPYGTQISGDLHNLQRYITESLEQFTGILLNEVNITVGKISYIDKFIRELKNPKKIKTEVNRVKRIKQKRDS